MTSGPETLTEKQLDAFWGKVDRSNSCWEWRGATTGSGYGWYSWKDPTTRIRHQNSVHRLVFLMAGKIPDGLLIRHLCHNPKCCNPAHLMPGTPKQNSADMVAANRNRSGPHHHNAHRSQEQVNILRKLLAREPYTDRELATLVGMTYANLKLIKSNKTWKAK